MITVTVDGKALNANVATLRSVGEVVELVKATIDPDTIITGLKFDGQELSESDWRMPLSAQGEKKLEILTGSREKFLSERVASAMFYLDNILKTFRDTAKALKDGDVKAGNTGLGKGVDDLKAFLNWYGTLMEMLPADQKEFGTKFGASLKNITDIAEQMVQQQLYRAWWGVAETIENKLAPELEALKGATVMLSQKQGA